AAASVLTAVVLWSPSMGGRGFHWRCSTFCRVGVAALALYLGACTVAHRLALERVERFAKLSGISVDHLAALPSPPSLFRWSGLIDSPQGVYRGSIDLAGSEPTAYAFFANAQDNPYLQAAESLPDVKIYLWFARFPWVTYHQAGDLHVVEI